MSIDIGEQPFVIVVNQRVAKASNLAVDDNAFMDLHVLTIQAISCCLFEPCVSGTK
jgi:hypothetical protein